VRPRLTEHEGHHECTSPHRVIHGYAVYFGDGLCEECGGLEETGCLRSGKGEGESCSESRDHGGCTDSSASGRNRGEIAALQNAHALRWRIGRMRATQGPGVVDDAGPLFREGPVDGAEPERRLLGRSFLRCGIENPHTFV